MACEGDECFYPGLPIALPNLPSQVHYLAGDEEDCLCPGASLYLPAQIPYLAVREEECLHPGLPEVLPHLLAKVSSRNKQLDDQAE